ncbi:MAG: site-2 protease family protein [Lachnospirales bacterium]
MEIKIGDFVIKIRLQFFLLTAILAALNMLGQFFIVVLLAFLHELSHIILARIYKAKISEIIISPVGFCAVIDLERLSLFRKLLVILIGPIFNIAFGIIFGNNISIALGIFNLLPVYPLDGGRFLSYLLGYIIGTLRANRYVANVNIIMSYLFVALGIIQMALFFGNISLLIVGIYILRINKKQSQQIAYNFYKTLIHKPNNRILKIRAVMVNKNTKLKTIIYRLGTDYYTLICIRDGDNIENVSEDKLQSFIIKNGIGYKAVDLISK